MPTYEYRCSNGHDFERFFRKISDAPSQVECGECGASAERRMSAGAALLFKGSGFYLTDYGRNAHRGTPPAKGESGGEPASAGESAGSKPSGEAAAPGGEPKQSGQAEAGKPAQKDGGKEVGTTKDSKPSSGAGDG
jgi:putative FmdB family regulatory protein